MDQSIAVRIGKCLGSLLIGAIIGVVIAEVVANSLIEISITLVFSIVSRDSVIFKHFSSFF